MIRDDKEHAERRRVLLQGLPVGRQAFDVVNETASCLASLLAEHSAPGPEWSTSIDISEYVRWFSFDFISKISFGESLSLLDSPENRWLPGCLEETSKFVYPAGYAGWPGFWQWFTFSRLPHVFRISTAVWTQKYSEFVASLFHKRVERKDSSFKGGQQTEPQDLIGHLLAAGRYNEPDLLADSQLLVAAGSDAVRFGICGTIFYLLRYPRSMEKVVAEIRAAVAPKQEISEPGLKNLTYLRACIDETLRLLPPKPSSIPREVGQGGIDIDGHHFQPGDTVGICIYSLHRDPGIYPDPDTFKPERWAEAAKRLEMRRAFCPFLKGPRMCPGAEIAYRAMILVLVQVLSRFDIRDASGRMSEQDEYPFKDFIIAFANGPEIQIRERG